MKRIAVVGSGVAGLGAAARLSAAAGDRHVTLFEADERFGGHAHTVDVTLADPSGKRITHGVDTGFLVMNERTYPQLLGLLDALGVARATSDMSFSVQVPQAARGLSGLRPGLEWCGSSLDTVFAQRRNLASPSFWRMLADLVRFNRLATALAVRGEDAELAQPISDFLRSHRFGAAFREGYLLPMIACIWSCPTEQMLRFPMATLIRFCHNHGLLQVTNRPQWYTVQGGSRQYVNRLVGRLADARLSTPVRGLTVLGEGGLGGVMLHTDAGTERFDEVVLACHSDQALAMLGGGATFEERELLGAVGYHRNRAVLHTDTSLLPRNPRAWAAWNYERAGSPDAEHQGVCLHYLINRLQPLPWSTPVIVSLNPLREPRADKVLSSHDYAHPVFDLAAIQAQKRLPEIQGKRGLWFCGAWTGYGFHEDGLKSGQGVAEQLLARDDRDAGVSAQAPSGVEQGARAWA
ncbi:NAD(P)/FAD-dependent oxidoreductase [Aquabacterium sp.]|uniref:NAD(P)/FAD-dependent oxidoreductase n=1 Tax=Aquabacterium sp. TaxID=1872578 RepID=UPI003D6D286E